MNASWGMLTLPYPRMRFLPSFLFFEKLPLPRRITAVAFRGHVLPQRGDRLTGDDLAADRGLDRDLEQACVSDSRGDCRSRMLLGIRSFSRSAYFLRFFRAA